ncbi:MAG: hypothetical protein ACTSRG_01970 [Candidatus Helarchaeota archaeon]
MKKNQEATYVGFNSTFMNVSGTIGTMSMGLFVFLLDTRTAFYAIGPIMGLLCFIAFIILNKLKID